MEISGDLSKETFSTGCGRVTLKNCLCGYFHHLKSSEFRLQVLRCAVSYSRVLTVLLN